MIQISDCFQIELDGVQIFRGEITCALNDSSSFAHGDVFLACFDQS